MWEWLQLHVLRFFGPEFWLGVVAVAIGASLLWRDYLTRGTGRKAAPPSEAWDRNSIR